MQPENKIKEKFIAGLNTLMGGYFYTCIFIILSIYLPNRLQPGDEAEVACLDQEGAPEEAHETSERRTNVHIQYKKNAAETRPRVLLLVGHEDHSDVAC